MKYVNKAHLPQSIHTWLAHDEYHKAGDISVTGLLEPPRVRLLTEKYDDHLFEDSLTRYKSRRGTAIHDSIEKANKDDNDLIQECIFFVDVLGWKIKGQFDEYRISTKTLTDFKTVGFYQFDTKKEQTLEKWGTQLNIYNYMIKKNTDHVPERLQVVAMLPDEPKNSTTYSFNKKTSKLIPDKCIYIVDIEMWDMNATEMVLTNLVKKHQRNTSNFKMGIGLDQCTDEERWTSFNKKTKKKKYLRCERFCPVSEYCDQFNPHLAELPF